MILLNNKLFLESLVNRCNELNIGEEEFKNNVGTRKLDLLRVDITTKSLFKILNLINCRVMITGYSRTLKPTDDIEEFYKMLDFIVKTNKVLFNSKEGKYIGKYAYSRRLLTNDLFNLLNYAGYSLNLVGCILEDRIKKYEESFSKIINKINSKYLGLSKLELLKLEEEGLDNQFLQDNINLEVRQEEFIEVNKMLGNKIVLTTDHYFVDFEIKEKECFYKIIMMDLKLTNKSKSNEMSKVTKKNSIKTIRMREMNNLLNVLGYRLKVIT